jgi:hypothetical protein
MSSEEMEKGEVLYKAAYSEEVASYDLLYITRAYNRKEISFEEWLKRSREWAEGIIKQYGKAD